jgi:hypothetical protein
MTLGMEAASNGHYGAKGFDKVLMPFHDVFIHRAFQAGVTVAG